MAKYVQAAGEEEILKDPIEGEHGDQRMPGFLVLTNRRAVLLVGKPSSVMRWLFGPLLSRLMDNSAPLELMGQIDRDDFAGIEQHDGQLISFHNKGDGYAHISFAVYSQIPFATWQQRIQQWISGASSTAPVAAELAER